jgi:glycosyltransferase involved in cell wall biosynthesis
MAKKNEQTFSRKLGLQQRVLPAYRAPFFQTLASKIEGGLSLFAGSPRPVEAIHTASQINGVELVKANNQHIFSKQFYLCKQTNIIEWLESSDPDVLIVEANARYLSTPEAIEWMHERSRKVLGWSLGAPPLRGALSSFRQKRRINLLSQLDGLISYSERGAEEFYKLGVSQDKIFVAHNAAAHRPSTPPPHKSKKKSGALNILFVGRLQIRKKLDNLFRACLEMEDQPNIVIAGDGPDRRHFELIAAKIYPKAVFVGAKYGDELIKYYSEADLFVLPGTGGLAVQEAMANGMPVIVAQGDGTQDDLVRPENGWLIPPDDQDALVSALKDASSDPLRLIKMGKKSFGITQNEINIDTMADKFIHAINAINQVAS